MSRALQLPGLLVVMLTGPGARADELYRLETHGWRRGCPGVEELRRQIAQSLGRDPFESKAGVPHKTVSVAIEGDAGGLGGAVEILGAGGELLGRRRIPSSPRRCTDLTRALALVVTLALDERSRLDGASGATSAGGKVASTAVAVQIEAPPAPPPRARDGPSWSVALGMSAGVGSGPGVVGAGRLALEARWLLWSLVLEAGADDQTGVGVAGGRVSGLRISAASAGCGWPRLFGVRILGVCGLVTAGDEHAQSSGFATAHPANGPSVDAGARLVWELVRAGRLSFAIDADALVPILRARFVLDGRTLWEAPPAAGDLGLRLAFAL